MRIDVHCWFHNVQDEGVAGRLLRMEKLLTTLVTQGAKQMADLDAVLADVAEERTQIDSLATLTAGLKKQLDDALAGVLTPEQQAKVDAIFGAVEANKQAVVDAINANTTPTP